MAQKQNSNNFRNNYFNKPSSPAPYKRTNSANDYKTNNNVSKPMYVQPKFNTHKGSHHEINFGKYKASYDQEPQTWYDLANKGEFNYIQWCLNTDKIDLHATTKPHAQTAILTQYDPKAKWNKKVNSASEENTRIVSYSARIDGEELTGPEVKEVCCECCQQFKNIDHFVSCPGTCDDCISKTSNNNF